MKAFLIFTIYLFSDVYAIEDFFKGMETGYTLRAKPFGYLDYDCPAISVDLDYLKVLNSFFAPIQHTIM